MDLCNKGKLMREFYTGEIVVVRKQAKSIIKYGVDHILVFKTKDTYRVLEMAKPSSYWIQCLPFCEVIGRTRIKVKIPAASMENIPSTMVIHKNVDRVDNRFSTMEGPLVKNTMGKWLGVIIIGSYRGESEDSRWAYEPVSYLWSDIEPYSESSANGSSDEGIKYQENPYDR